MVADLAAHISRVRSELAEVPEAITFAKIPPGVSPDEELPGDLAVLLEITNVPRFGMISFSPVSGLPLRQRRCDHLAGGQRAWFFFACNGDFPIYIKRNNGEVYWDPTGDYETVPMRGEVERLSSGVMAFVQSCVFGPCYRRLVYYEHESDSWYKFLRDRSLFLEEPPEDRAES